MELAIHFPYFTVPGGAGAIGPALSEAARAAEDGGCTTFTLMDHYLQIPGVGTPDEPMLEGYTTLGFLAGRTSSIRLGLLVTGVTYRRPALLAKIVTTLDVVSGGRAQLGLGAAWFQQEHDAYGVPFPPVGERLDLLEETVQVCRAMWSDDDGPYEGRHVRLGSTYISPRPVQRPAPPVMIAGGGEKRLLRMVARYADACNLMALGGDTATVAHKLAVLDRHCVEVGRDPAEVRRTVITDRDPATDPDGFLTEMEVLAGLGVTQVYCNSMTPEPVAWVTRAVEVVPRLADLGPA